MRLADYRAQPPAEPAVLAVCAGCGDPILAGEACLLLESGTKLHDHPDCKVWLVDRMAGLRR